jgi:hypothetical protein
MSSGSKATKSSRSGPRTPKIVEIPLEEIDTQPCEARRAEPVVLSGMEESLRIAGQTSLALVAHEKKRGKWLLLDGWRIFTALKELGAPTLLAEVADRDPARAQLQVVHRHNVMPHTTSAKVRLLVQWKAAYEALHPRATKHGGDRRKQARSDASMSFRKMAAAEWKTTPSTIDRYLKLKHASAEVLRGLDDEQLTLTEAGMLVGKTCDDHARVLATKNAQKYGARRAVTDAVEHSQATDRDRLWDVLATISGRLLALYPEADPARVEQLTGKTWLDALAAALDPMATAAKEAA